MIGITAHGVYIPLHRLGKGTSGWAGRGEKAVANYDEDSVTMAVAAAIDCMNGVDARSVGGLYFASTTAPFLEKQSAVTVARGADLPIEIITADITNSTRAGTIAMRSALDAVKAGSVKQMMVASADVRIAKPGHPSEATIGDGAAVVIVGDSKVIAEVEDSLAISEEMFDVYQSRTDRYVRFWEDRFGLEGYTSLMGKVTSEILSKNKLSLAQIDIVVLYASDLRRHKEMVSRLGLNEAQIQNPMLDTVGNTGTASVLMMLSAALESAKPGQRILVVNYGSGADAFLLRVTEEVTKFKPKHGISAFLESKRLLDSYHKYLRWREILDVEPIASRPPQPVPSAVGIWRGQDAIMRFYGVKCKNCGYPQFPPQRVCTICRTKDQFEPYKFADKKASLYSYAADYLDVTLDPPAVLSVINFDGGGRAVVFMADRDINALEVDMPLEMTFRKMYSAEGINHYFWKCMPIRVAKDS